MKSRFRIIAALKDASPIIEAVAILLVAISLVYAHRETNLISDQVHEARRQTELVHEANKRMYTFDLLSDLSENGQLANANYAMVRLINAGALVGADENGMPIITNKDKIKPRVLENLRVDDRELVDLLNYYELIGSAYANNVLDKDLVLQVRGGPISRAYDLCQGYIDARRASLGGENLYENMQLVAREFRRLMNDR